MLFFNYENFTASDSAFGNNLANFNPIVSVSIGSANVWTSNVALISSTPFDSYGVSVIVHPSFNGGSTLYNRFVSEIYEGASGSEVKLIDTFTAKGADDFEYALPNNHIYYPIFIPAGKRLSFRAKMDVSSSSSVRMGLHFYRSSYSQTGWFGNKITTYGYDDSSLKGVDVTPNATADTWGSWTQITASTSRHHKAFITEFFPVTSKSVPSNRGYAYQVAIGASGSEAVISPVYRQGQGSSDQYSPRLEPIYKYIPAGSRLSVRSKCSASSGSATSVIIQGIS
jgi:hypothetical protein